MVIPTFILVGHSLRLLISIIEISLVLLLATKARSSASLNAVPPSQTTTGIF